MKYVLLLTACIQPSDENLKKNNIQRSDPIIRLEDYQKALHYWLNEFKGPLHGIVFVENSGYSLESLKEIAFKFNKHNIATEFLQQLASPLKQGLHYGYSELELIDYAFEKSELISECDYVIKTTGRLYFTKLGNLIKKLPLNYDIAIDIKDYKIFNKEKHYANTTIFLVKKDFYLKELLNAKRLMAPINKQAHIEKIYFNILKDFLNSKSYKVLLRFPFTMHPTGFGAHWNFDYSSPKKILISYLRDISRVIFPKLWI